MTVDDELTRLRRRLTEINDRLDQRRPDPVQATPVTARVMFVVSDITAMAGDVTGVGQAVDAVYDPATFKLTAGTGANVDIRNYHEKKFLAGGIIEAVPRYGAWFAVDVNMCSKYQ